MFESLFNNAEEDTGHKTSVKEDVAWILKNTKYPLLSAAWDEFLHIVRNDPRYDEDDSSRNLYGRASYPWYALQKLQGFSGDLTQFPLRKIHLLYALKDGYEVYDEMMHVLMDHHNDEKEADLLFRTHPNLHKHLPKQYDNSRQAMEVLVEVVRLFRLELEQFSQKHSAEIDTAIRKIVKKAQKDL